MRAELILTKFFNDADDNSSERKFLSQLIIGQRIGKRIYQSGVFVIKFNLCLLSMCLFS